MAELTVAQISALKARADKAREFSLTVGTTQYTLRRPTLLRWRELLLSNLGSQPSLERAAVLGAVVAWSGPVVADVDPEPETPELGQLPLPCQPDMVDLYLMDRPKEYHAISAALMEAINKAQGEAAAEKKA